jgi:hypothetical protein
MKRIFSVLAVTALMVAMLVASVSPVLAKNQRYTAECVDPETGFTQIVVAKQKKIEKIIEDVENVGFVCGRPEPI